MQCIPVYHPHAILATFKRILLHKNPNKAEYSLESNKRDIPSSCIDYIFLRNNL